MRSKVYIKDEEKVKFASENYWDSVQKNLQTKVRYSNNNNKFGEHLKITIPPKFWTWQFLKAI